MVAIVFIIFLVLYFGSTGFYMMDSLIHLNLTEVFGWILIMSSTSLFLILPSKKE